MEFRPCIDLHNGEVKQIVGGSLQDQGDRATENFRSGKGAGYYAQFFRDAGLRGGHVILLNAKDSPYYEKTRAQAFEALRTFPGGLQVGGGITPESAQEYLDAGASHVIVTSYVFHDGMVDTERIRKMREAVGKEHLVLDLSCKRVVTEDGQDRYLVVTDRWQNLTRTEVTPQLLEQLSADCDEFLIHAVDVEGKAKGPEQKVLKILARVQGIPVTYAGGIASVSDLRRIGETGEGRIHVCVGSALDLYGGKLEFQKVLSVCREYTISSVR